MIEVAENQSIASTDAERSPSASKTSKNLLPLLFGKKDLCVYLGIFSASHTPNIRLLRRKVLTDDVCRRAGFDWLDYEKKSYFSLEHCQRLRRELKLE